MTSDHRVHGQGWGSRSESSTSLKCGTSVFFIVHNLLIRKHSYLDIRYPVGLAFIPCHRTRQILVHLENVVILL